MRVWTLLADPYSMGISLVVDNTPAIVEHWILKVPVSGSFDAIY
jgi:hypothetical protein